MPIPFGHFDLIESIGKGGMGEVWRGIHRKQQLPIAMKVITAEQAQTEQKRRALAAEVRAMAGLNHPRIVVVLDHGPVTPEAAEKSDGRLVEGSPAFAMELGGETLREW
jgi:eukaryotic-like serine/threonine-protein kinase